MATTAAMTAAGVVIVEEIVVKMEVGLSMSKDNFTNDKQEAFTQGLANTAGVLKKNVRITSVVSVFLRRRRLLTGSIKVSTEVVVQNMSHGEAVSSQMTSNNLNIQMSQMGLPELEVLQSARVVVAPSSMTTPAPIASAITTAVDTTVVLASTPMSVSTSQEVVMDADTTGNTVGLTTVIASSLAGIIMMALCCMLYVILYLTPCNVFKLPSEFF